MRPAIPVADLSEKDWAKQLFETKKGLAYSTGWRLVYHTFRSRNSPTGFPDWVLVRDRVIYAELKTEEKASKPTPRQIEWLDGLARAGAEVYLWRPRDLDEVGLILGQRWAAFVPYREQGADPIVPPHLVSIHRGWTPGSAWIPGVGRAELLGSAV